MYSPGCRRVTGESGGQARPMRPAQRRSPTRPPRRQHRRAFVVGPVRDSGVDMAYSTAIGSAATLQGPWCRNRSLPNATRWPNRSASAARRTERGRPSRRPRRCRRRLPTRSAGRSVGDCRPGRVPRCALVGVVQCRAEGSMPAPLDVGSARRGRPCGGSIFQHVGAERSAGNTASHGVGLGAAEVQHAHGCPAVPALTGPAAVPPTPGGRRCRSPRTCRSTNTSG